jgi:hypothetical protein
VAGNSEALLEGLSQTVTVCGIADKSGDVAAIVGYPNSIPHQETFGSAERFRYTRVIGSVPVKS